MPWFRSATGSKKSAKKLARTVHRSAMVTAEALESRTLFTAGPTITLIADTPTGSGITGANARFTFSRDGSTASPIKVYYHGSGTINSHQYTKLPGYVIIHAGQSFAYVDVKPVTGLVLATDPTLSLVTTQYKTYRRGPHVATVTITENHGSTGTGGNTNGEQYSVPITINSGSYARTDEPVDNSINLTSSLSSLNASGTIVDNSIRVVETNSAGTVVNGSVPFQFNKASNYDATTNASGDMIIDLTGATAANTNRYFQVQFATSGSFSAPSFTSQVSSTTTTDSVGLSALKISNATASYYLQQSTGGFSEIKDTDGNDWVGFNSGGQSSGEYRGVPNLGVPAGLHPYDPSGNFPTSGAQNTATTTVLNSGPLETTVDVATTDGTNTNHVIYKFYNNFVQAQVVSVSTVNSNNNTNYWFLYEGTPGGSFSTSDQLVASDGTSGALNQGQDWSNGIGSGNASTGQWASFQSAGENRFIYFAQNTQDTTEDSYYDLNDQMTVFGFGRTSPNSNPAQQEEETGSNTYTFGIANGNSTAAATINGQYRAISGTVGSAASLS